MARVASQATTLVQTGSWDPSLTRCLDLVEIDPKCAQWPRGSAMRTLRCQTILPGLHCIHSMARKLRPARRHPYLPLLSTLTWPTTHWQSAVGLTSVHSRDTMLAVSVHFSVLAWKGP